MNKVVRQAHRWVSVLFTLTVVVNIVAMIGEPPPLWVNYLPLPFLFLLLFTGLYLFVLPYTAKGRAQRAE